tara:strand:- start:1766 stop:2170 length:405 start_codon:yes stop_codon:yes gene_type:complete
MEWIDIILDHVSKYKVENISKIEKKYLEQFDTDKSEALQDVLDERVKYYKKAVDYDIKDAYFYDEEMWGNISSEGLKDTRLSLLWEIILDDDFETFIKIYNIPYIIISSDWTHLDHKHKDKFEDYWKSYYNFNI